ncbi:aldo/keto reductase [Luteimonas sp. BDR2-5]|uniref:aldo/keto reductase n=1 Tax=Proluteimonas luteida TaxID=2878685 RepID=UPI001E3B0BC6|nr:aldo/keto reductase [Luteimonas sp. BDR2-5]MCD9027767.1 aldo/keto reductase [Luteimonas sp. BDR2-5]
MHTRRSFLSAAALGAATLAAAPLLARAQTAPGDVLPTLGTPDRRPLPVNPQGGPRFRPASRLGLGGAPLGNNFAPVAEADAQATLQAAWDAGVRMFDTSPWYGLGLSERRFGHFLAQQNRDDYVISTKTGRLLTATKQPPETNWKNPSPFDYRYDYSAAGTRRSVEDSLQRLGIDAIDIVLVHDLSPDNGDMGERWTEYFEQARTGAFVELAKMRDEGLIKAWGLGVNTPDPALRAIEVADPDIFLLACQYSLLDHQRTLDDTFPKLAARDISVIVGSPLLAGFLVGRDRYLYGGRPVPPGAAEKREQAGRIAAAHGIDLRTAALQFAAAPEVVSAIIPGARNAAQTTANAASMTVAIPPAFWDALREAGIIAANAPVPAPV